MAEHRRVDEYGNPILKVDEYGNPIHGESHGTGGYGTGTGAYGTGTGTHGTGIGTGTHGTGTVTGTYGTGLTGTGAQHQPERTKEGHGISGVLHRSGSSSSSSSSEDDGMGGRRKKKSIKEKIKEKLPGTHKSEEGKTPTTTPITSTGTGGHGYGTTGTGGHGYGTTGDQHGYGGTGTTVTGEHEKKGIMEKIKEKLPGHH